MQCVRASHDASWGLRSCQLAYRKRYRRPSLPFPHRAPIRQRRSWFFAVHPASFLLCQLARDTLYPGSCSQSAQEGGYPLPLHIVAFAFAFAFVRPQQAGCSHQNVPRPLPAPVSLVPCFRAAVLTRLSPLLLCSQCIQRQQPCEFPGTAGASYQHRDSDAHPGVPLSAPPYGFAHPAHGVGDAPRYGLYGS